MAGLQQGSWAADQLSQRLLEDDELKQSYELAVNTHGARTFHRKHVKVLKVFLRGLWDTSGDDGQRRVYRFLHALNQRARLSLCIANRSHGGSTPYAAASSALSTINEYLEDEEEEAPEKWQIHGEGDESRDITSDDTIHFIHMLSDGIFENNSPFKKLKERVQDLPYDPKSLSEALEQRNLRRLKTFLDEHIDEAANGEYEWLEGLRKLGYSNHDMAQFLYHSVTDSPWIYYYPTPSMTNLRLIMEDHRPSCPYELLSRDARQDRASTSDHPDAEAPGDVTPQISEDQSAIIEHFCGLGSVSPFTRDAKQWAGRVEFEKKGKAALVTSHRATLEEIADDFDRPFRPGRYRLSSALAHARAARLCCCSFTLLTHSRPARDGDAPEVLLVSLSLSEMCEALPYLVPSMMGSPAVWRHHSRPDEARSLLGRIFPDAPLSDETFRSADEVHWGSLVIQLLSTSLLSYKQAHAGSLRPFFLDTPVEEIHLLGTNTVDDSSLPSIRAQLVELSCLSKLTKGPALVFTPSWASDGSWPQHGDEKFNVRGTPEAVMDTWGPGEFISRDEDPQLFVAMQIGLGYVYPSNTASPPTYHFGGDLKLPDECPNFEPGMEIVVGHRLETYTNCRNVESDCRTVSDNTHCLEWIGTHPSYYEICQRQAALQVGGHGVTGQLAWVQQKRPADVVKERLLLDVRKDDRRPLNQALHVLKLRYGLRISFCTAVAQRVSLGVVAADLLPEMVSRTDREEIEDWKRLKDTHKALVRLRNPEASLEAWVLSLPDELKKLLHDLVCKVLHALGSTGIDDTGNNFNILWLHGGEVGRGLKVPVRGTNRWTSVLKDTDTFATFAYVSNICLVSDTTTCRGPNPSWPGTLSSLETLVYVGEAGAPKALEDRQAYYFILDTDTLWFRARRAPRAEDPWELVCLNSVVSFPRKTLVRLRVSQRRARKNRMLSEHHITPGEVWLVNVLPSDNRAGESRSMLEASDTTIRISSP